ncbi:MAG: hypothetical protein IT193_07400 [Propionibacteriaceae bacterium]|nr:hypothetical protein [Propionibacteriaceae bacterium]
MSNSATMSVGIVTVREHALLPELPETSFGFCDAASCPVVYVGADGTLIDKAHVRTRVGVKETEDPIPVCYCFELTAVQIADDVRTHGQSTIRDYIQEQVRAGRCRCETTNPSGRCCLGNVGRVLSSVGAPAPSR